MSRQHRQDVLTGAGLFIFSLILLFYLIPNFVSASTHTEMSPRFFPTLAAILLAVLSLGLTLVSLRGMMKDADPGTFSALLKPNIRFNPKSGPVLTCGIICAYFLGFEYGSFVLATPVAMVLFMLAFGQRKPLRIICVSIVFTAVVYVMFTYGLKVPLE